MSGFLYKIEIFKLSDYVTSHIISTFICAPGWQHLIQTPVTLVISTILSTTFF